LQKKSALRFVTGHDFSRADKPFISLPEPALAGGIGRYFDSSRSLRKENQFPPRTYSRTIFSDWNAFIALRVSTISFADESSPL
jgi:hypothetical protein